MARALTAQLTGTSTTTDSAVRTARLLIAQLISTSTTTDALLVPESGVVQFVAALLATSQTSDATVVSIPRQRVMQVPAETRVLVLTESG